MPRLSGLKNVVAEAPSIGCSAASVPAAVWRKTPTSPPLWRTATSARPSPVTSPIFSAPGPPPCWPARWRTEARIWLLRGVRQPGTRASPASRVPCAGHDDVGAAVPVRVARGERLREADVSRPGRSTVTGAAAGWRRCRVDRHAGALEHGEWAKAVPARSATSKPMPLHVAGAEEARPARPRHRRPPTGGPCSPPAPCTTSSAETAVQVGDLDPSDGPTGRVQHRRR